MSYFGERISPHERRFPDDLYDVWEMLNKQAAKQPKLNMDDFSVPPKVKSSQREELARREAGFQEQADYSIFMEAALPETAQAEWFGPDIFINRYSGDAARHNDITGTDMMFEMEGPDGKTLILRVDTTKESDPEKIENKKIGSILAEIRSGEFTSCYFESRMHPGERRIVYDAPRVILHMTEEQIINLGREIKNVSEKKPGSNRKLAENPTQINLIEQAESQLENQIMYAVAIFLEKINRSYKKLRLAAEVVDSLKETFEQVKSHLKRWQEEDESINVMKLADKMISNEEFQRLPGYREAEDIIRNIMPWLSYFQKLWQEKRDLLPESAWKTAKVDSEISEPHRLLVYPPMEIPERLPRKLDFAA